MITRLLLAAALAAPGVSLAAQTAAPRCVRSLPSSAKPGDTVGVALALDAGPGGELVLTEEPPGDWQIGAVSAGGAWDGHRLTWRLAPAAGEPVLVSYSVRLPADASGVGVFHGEGAFAGAAFTVDGAETVPIGASISVGGFDVNTWELIGLLGTLLFASRFILQWIASERAGRSVVPTAFWYFSIAGSVILTAYGIHFRRLTVVVGQAPGFLVYARNLVLIRNERRRQRLTAG